MGHGSAQGGSAQPVVAWQEWSKATFDLAKQQNKPILVSVGTTWCHWCHVMDEQTFAAPAVAQALQRDFVAIRGDADARPDLGERYAEWGWPATAILTPDAQTVQTLRGYQEANGFLALLSRVTAAHREGRLQPQPEAAAPPEAPTEVSQLLQEGKAQLDSYYDPRRGGWGRYQKYPYSAPIELSLWRAQMDQEPVWRDRAIATLRGMRKLLDPAWGGMYQYSLDDRWDRPHFEKIATIQAGAIHAFSLAALATGKGWLLRDAEATAGYVQRFLQSPAGTFWASQDADSPDLEGAAFYALRAGGRAQHATPRVDAHVYTDANAMLIHAFCAMHRASGKWDDLATAERAARAIVQSCQRPTGAFGHAAEPSDLIHLRDNAAMGRAVVELHDLTGDPAWLDIAQRVAGAILGTLRSPSGAFWAHSIDPAATGVFRQPRTPLEENGLAIRFLYELAWRLDESHPKRAALLQTAGEAVNGVRNSNDLVAEGRAIGNYLLALETAALEPLKITLAGNPVEPGWPAMRNAALRYLRPGTVVRGPHPGDPVPAVPTAYLCLGSRCSQPVTKARRLHAAAASLGA